MAAGIAAIAGAAGNTFDTLLNGGLQIWQNNQNRQNQEDQYNTERDDAIDQWNRETQFTEDMWNKSNAYNEQMWNQQNAYNLQMWNMQNAYNDPSAQMARLKAAGINPVTAYGGISNSGPAIDASQLAHASAPSAPSSSMPHMAASQGTAPKFDVGAGIMSYLGIQQQQAQVDNIRKQNELLDIKAQADTAQLAKQGIDIETAGYDRDFKRDTLGYSVDSLKLNTMKSAQDLQLSNNADIRAQHADTRAQQLQPATLAKLVQDIKTAQSQNQLNISDAQSKELQQQLMRYEVMLNDHGIQKSDSFLSRSLGKLWETPIFQSGHSLQDLFNAINGSGSTNGLVPFK